MASRAKWSGYGVNTLRIGAIAKCVEGHRCARGLPSALPSRMCIECAWIDGLRLKIIGGAARSGAASIAGNRAKGLTADAIVAALCGDGRGSIV